jgi:moderate conductance mechanosensitive channel
MKTRFAFFRAAFLAIALAIAWSGFCKAQEAPLRIVIHPGQSEADVRGILDLAARSGRSVTVEVATPATAVPVASPALAGAPVEAAAVQTAAPLPQPAAPATNTPPPPMTPTPEMMATDMGMAKWAQFSAAFRRGAATALSGVGSLPAAMGMADDRLIAEGSGYGRALILALAALGVAALATLALRRFVAIAIARRPAAPPAKSSRVRQSLLRLVGDLASIAFFLAGARLALSIMGAPGPITAQAADGMVTAVIVSLLYISLARLLFKTDGEGCSLIPIRRPGWHFRILVTYGLISAALAEMARLADGLGVDRLVIDGWFLTGNTLLTILKLYWFIGGRNDIRDAFTGHSPGIARRVVGNLLPDFYVATALALWLICVLFAGTPNSARWIFAAGSTQMALLALPILALGAHALVDDLARHHAQTHGAGLASAFLSSLRVLCAGLVWVGGLHLIAAIWSPFIGGSAELASSWATWLERLSLAIVASWAVASFIWHYSEALAPAPAVTLPGQEDQTGKRETSRLSTALPVVRNLALGAVLAVGSLVVLSSLGVNVAPLLAGFGVLGLALSFGSQALVKDIVSGIFFIAEDSFRIGEYISTGDLQGTVEQIAIRSVRLRHHNGPVHTVPFGQINSVSNFSRDWGTIKFELKFEPDSDLELIRKTAKKVGIAMQEDPEFGADFLIPLKMQGIQDITENSLVVRFKFTSVPGNPSVIKRAAIKRLVAAYKAAGVEFASNAVTVRSRGDTPPDELSAATFRPLAPAISA